MNKIKNKNICNIVELAPLENKINQTTSFNLFHSFVNALALVSKRNGSNPLPSMLVSGYWCSMHSYSYTI